MQSFAESIFSKELKHKLKVWIMTSKTRVFMKQWNIMMLCHELIVWHFYLVISWKLDFISIPAQ